MKVSTSYFFKQTDFHHVNTISDVNKHTMEVALHKYMRDKVHQLVPVFTGKKIVVRGKHKRSNCVINTNEKSDKLFNWKRPTAEVSTDKKTLYVNCFPGKDYVYHYASIISSYLCLNTDKSVEVIVEPPDAHDTFEELLKTNFTEIPECDVVIIGTVEKLHRLTSYNIWQGSGDFCWSESKIDNKKILLLGCEFSYWGDIAGRITELLASKKIKTIIYSGKLGGLKANMNPNTTLATGDKSLLLDKEICWKNIFSDYSIMSEVECGEHYTLPSVLYEDKDWFKNVCSKYSFVDPEIGWIAYAAKMNDINFSYLHIISDNLACVRNENLSNERKKSIILKRSRTMRKILNIFEDSVRLM